MGFSATMRPSALVFDLDGTLADSFAAIGLALNRALREVGLPRRTPRWVRRHVGRGATALVASAVGGEEQDARVQDVAERFAARYGEIFLEQTPPYPGVHEVLRFVWEGSGGRTAVLSNKSSRLCGAWLEHWELAHFVAVLEGPDTTGVRKPDPGALAVVLERLSARSEDALMVGDMDIDVVCGAALGVGVVAVQGGACSRRELQRAGALQVLADLRDLPGWLAGNGRGWRIR